MLVEIKTVNKQECLVIAMPVNKGLPLSTSGKSRIVCTSHGNKDTGVTIKNEHNKDDNQIVVGVTAFVRAHDDKAMERQAIAKTKE